MRQRTLSRHRGAEGEFSELPMRQRTPMRFLHGTRNFSELPMRQRTWVQTRCAV